MPDLASDITDAAALPQSTTVDGHSTSERSIDSLIRADLYAGAGASARAQRRRGITFSKAIPSGPLSDQGQTLTVSPFDGGVH